MLWTDEKIKAAADNGNSFLDKEIAVSFMRGMMTEMRDEYEAMRAEFQVAWEKLHQENSELTGIIAELEEDLQRMADYEIQEANY